MSKKGATTLSRHKKRQDVSPTSMEHLKAELREMVSNQIVPLESEPDYATDEKTLMRFLRARGYVVKDAFKQLKHSIEWRRSYRPLMVECCYCADRPGFHGMRQIGFDLMRRPVFYACFLQCQTLKNTPEDIVQHVVYLVENGFRCGAQTSDELVFVLDCTGFTLGCCNPKIGKTFVQTFGDNYPEHLGKFFLVNHNPILHSVWKAIKVFIDPKTSKKVKLIKKNQLYEVLNSNFDAETVQWLMTEIELNRFNIPVSQLRFWEAPGSSQTAVNSMHDPRGSPSYVNRFIEPLAHRRDGHSGELISRDVVGWTTHLPHPNIVQQLNGTVPSVPLVEPKASGKGPSKQELRAYGVDHCEPSTSTVSEEEDSSD